MKKRKRNFFQFLSWEHLFYLAARHTRDIKALGDTPSEGGGRYIEEKYRKEGSERKGEFRPWKQSLEKGARGIQFKESKWGVWSRDGHRESPLQIDNLD